LLYMKTKERSWKKNHGIWNISIEDCRNMIRDKYWKCGRNVFKSSTVDLIDQRTWKSNLKRK
jgi:hypothetical protein